MDRDLEQLRELATDLDATVSHGSAGLVYAPWGVRLPEPPQQPTLTVGRNRSRAMRAGVTLHRNDLKAAEVWRVGGIPVTEPLRTVTDLARTLRFEHGVAVADSMLASGLVSERELIEILPELRGAGSARARQTLQAADGRSQSIPESVMRVYLQQFPRLGRVIPQFRLCRNGHPYDLGLPELRLLIEYQSWEWHNERRVWRRDARWGNEAWGNGWGYLQVVHEDLVAGPAHLARLVLGV